MSKDGRTWLDPPKALAGAIIALLTLASPAAAEQPPQPNDMAYSRGLPPIGKWMVGQDGSIAHWLGESVAGKELREPINIILIDEISASPAESTARVVAASAAAGFPIRSGHSGGYRALIDGKSFPQVPDQPDRAFSNEIAEVANNHGRLFGPYRLSTGYLFIGAFSREEVRIASVPHHAFGSFDQGRDGYARALDEKTAYKISAFINLGNAVVGDRAITTGDHDGIAVLLRANR